MRTRSSGDVDEGVEEGAVAGELEGLHRGRVGFVGGGILVDGGLGLRGCCGGEHCAEQGC